jgi:quercetin dioxygenase-like cupin family protein
MPEVTRRTGDFDERAVVTAFAREGLAPHRWSTGPRDVFAPHAHEYHKVLYCLRGSIVFGLADGTEIALAPGDRLDLERGTTHSAVVGPTGVECMEAPRRA